MCDRNQVSVSGTETKVQFWYQYWSQKFFFRNRNSFFQHFKTFLMFFCFLGGYKFLKAWNWTQIFKNNLKILNIWQPIWFKGFFYDWKIQGMSCEGACKIHSGKCAGGACMRPFFGRAVCNHTFAHFLGQNCQKMLHFRTSFPVLKRPFLFWIILFCFRTSCSVLEHTKP